MKRYCLPVVLAASLVSCACAQLPGPISSTEKINVTCYLYIDRKVPITMPTYQMKPGSSIVVTVLNPFHFETLTLDPQTIQALPGTDQGGSLVTSILPDFKGLVVGSTNNYFSARFHVLGRADAATTAGADIATVQADIAAAQAHATAVINPSLTKYTAGARSVYGELKEIALPVPRPMESAVPLKGPERGADVPDGTPNPWDDYKDWREFLLCQLEGDIPSCTAFPGKVDVKDLMQMGRDLVSQLPGFQTSSTTGSFAQPANTQYFDPNSIEKHVKTAQTDIALVKNADEQTRDYDALGELVEQYHKLFNTLSSYSANVTKINTDLETYRTNITLWSDYDSIKSGRLYLGVISDPNSGIKAAAPAKMLGRQIAYSIDSDNQVVNLALAVPSSTQKVSIATITVIYANPRFEVSVGSIISFQHNRGFAYQQAVQPPANSGLSVGDIYIAETRTRPEVIPFVAGNVRIIPEFTWGSPGRRGAVYGSIWVGLNPYNTLPEYGAGPTISFRSIMLSGFYHRSHDIRLLEGEYPYMIWCNLNNSSTSSPSTLPAQPSSGASCTPTPPAPATQTYWTNAFGIGISIRVPTSFTAGTGGVSR